ncbi:MAG TPA: hypothetical protein VEV87_04750, partial [Chitinophagaceae bacterium]|nr:hypothetical protein [Chitinophagaceae bacterium]
IRFVPEKKILGNRDETISIALTSRADEKALANARLSFDTARIWMAAYKKDVDEPVILPTDLTLKNITSTKQQLNAKVKLALESGNYTVRLGITSCIHNWPTINSSVTALKVK